MTEAGPEPVVVVQRACTGDDLPDAVSLKRWARLALAAQPAAQKGDLVIRIVGAEESAQLNERYRGKLGPTNVLSFPFDERWPFPDEQPRPLGDVVICAERVGQEAKAQDKAVMAHWAHLVIHGTLHLLGYTHDREQPRRSMETIERCLLAQLGFADPYGDEAAA